MTCSTCQGTGTVQCLVHISGDGCDELVSSCPDCLHIRQEIERLRSLRGEELEKELLSRRWYVHENDLIGGHCVMPVDAPPSSGCFEVGDFLSQDLAQHIVDLHNSSLGSTEGHKIEHDHTWKQTAGLSVGDVYTCQDCGAEEVRNFRFK